LNFGNNESALLLSDCLTSEERSDNEQDESQKTAHISPAYFLLIELQRRQIINDAVRPLFGHAVHRGWHDTHRAHSASKRPP
jgi:hypothetical protein